MIAENPANGHAHPGWKLSTPVACHDAAHARPQQYLAAIERGFRRRLGADPNYAGLIAKNPMHPHWRTLWVAPYPYSLQQLAACLDRADMRPAPTPHEEAGQGRNCALFDYVRRIAYREVAATRRAGSREAFIGHLTAIALEFNAGFMPPLRFGEVRATVRSIVKWSWINVGDSVQTFSRQAQRGVWSGLARRAVAQDRRIALAGLLSDTGSWRSACVRELSTQLGIPQRTLERDLSQIERTPLPGAALEKPVMIFGRSMTRSDAAAGAGVSLATLSRRIAKGLRPEIAAILPARNGTRTHSLARLGLADLPALMRAAMNAPGAVAEAAAALAELGA